MRFFIKPLNRESINPHNKVLSKIGFRQWLQEIAPNLPSLRPATSFSSASLSLEVPSDILASPKLYAVSFHSLLQVIDIYIHSDNANSMESFVYDVDEQSVRLSFQEYSLFPSDASSVRVIVTAHPNYFGNYYEDMDFL